MIDNDYSFRKNDTIIHKELDGAPILIDPYRRTLTHLNPVALEIWKLLDGKRPVSAMLEALREEFDIDETVLRKDVLGFLDELAKREMIE